MMIKMNSEKLLYEGKAKSVFQGENDDEVIFSINNYLAADGEKKSFAETISDLEKLLRQIPECHLGHLDEAAVCLKRPCDVFGLQRLRRNAFL